MTLSEFTKTDMFQFGDIMYLSDDNGRLLNWLDDGSLDNREVVAWKMDKEEGSISITVEATEPDVVQFSIDLADTEINMEEKINKALEAAGLYVLGIEWKATWTNDGYHKGEPPVDSD